MKREISPAEQLETFLNMVDVARAQHSLAIEGQRHEDRRQQDLLHEIEFTASSKKRYPLSTELHVCRQARREHKDTMKRYEQIVIFFQEPQHQKTLNQLRQLLGRQRREEDFLNSERVYKPRT